MREGFFPSFSLFFFFSSTKREREREREGKVCILSPPPHTHTHTPRALLPLFAFPLALLFFSAFRVLHIFYTCDQEQQHTNAIL